MTHDAKNGELLVATPDDSVKVWMVKITEEDLETQELANGVVFALLCDMAVCFTTLGHFKEARKCLAEAASLRPNHIVVQTLSLAVDFSDRRFHTVKKMRNLRKKIKEVLAEIAKTTNGSFDPMAAMTSNFYVVAGMAKQLKRESKIVLKELEAAKAKKAEELWGSWVAFQEGYSGGLFEEEAQQRLVEFKETVNLRKRIAKKVKSQLQRLAKLTFFGDKTALSFDLEDCIQKVRGFLAQLSQLPKWTNPAYVCKWTHRPSPFTARDHSSRLQAQVLFCNQLKLDVEMAWEKTDVPIPILQLALQSSFARPPRTHPRDTPAGAPDGSPTIWQQVTAYCSALTKSIEKGQWVIVVLVANALLLGALYLLNSAWKSLPN